MNINQIQDFIEQQRSQQNLSCDQRPCLLVIAGATAVGKTELSIGLAEYYKTSIISADSRQFYREMSIGTAKPVPEDLSRVPHYFVGNLSITDYYSVSKFEQDVLRLLPDLFAKNPFIIMTGGSGLYIDAVCRGIDELPDPDPNIRQNVIKLFENEGIETLRNQIKCFDPIFYEQTDIANPKRLMRALEVILQTGKPYSQQLTSIKKQRDFDIIKIYLNRTREDLFERINLRVDKMIEEGLLEEAKNLFPYSHLNALNTVGYKEIFDYFNGKISLEQAIDKIKIHTRRYAKRQMTWFN